MRRDEFEHLAIAELDALHRFARFLTRDAQRAEDLVQDVYARAFRPGSIESFSTRGGGMRAWLMTIARTSFYGALEHESAGRRAMSFVTEQAKAEGRGDFEPVDATAADRVDWDLVGPIVGAAVDRLSPELREVLWFWGVEGLKYREIAEALDVPIGTVMSRLHRARSQVAKSVASNSAATRELNQQGFISPGENVAREPVR